MNKQAVIIFGSLGIILALVFGISQVVTPRFMVLQCANFESDRAINPPGHVRERTTPTEHKPGSSSSTGHNVNNITSFLISQLTELDHVQIFPIEFP
jgi:hypothetical protein